MSILRKGGNDAQLAVSNSRDTWEPVVPLGDVEGHGTVLAPTTTSLRRT